MSEQIFVKPCLGLTVRHPEKLNYILPPEGELVTNSAAWQRLIRFGDVEVVEQSTENKTETKKGNK